ADIQKGFVNGDLFHQSSEIVQALHHLTRDFAVEVVTRRNDDQPRAESERFRHRHGRTDSHPPRSIRAGSHYAAFIWLSSHCKGFVAQLRVASFFHRAEEGVQVYVKDCAWHSLYYKEKRVIATY